MITIFSVNDEYFTNYDLAVLKSAGTNYKIKSHDVNDTVDLEAQTDGSDVYVCDEYDNRIDVEYELNLKDITGYEDDKRVLMYEAEDLGVNGKSLDYLNTSYGLSDELTNSIIHECDNLAYAATEIGDDGEC